MISTILFSTFTWIQYKDYDGIYNPASQLMRCTDENACIHELMHYMDDSLDWPSQSSEFLKIVNTLKHKESIILTMEYRTAFAFPTNRHTEFYARLFTYYYTHRDEVPNELASFYDWEIVDKFSVEPGFYWLVPFLGNNT